MKAKKIPLWISAGDWRAPAPLAAGEGEARLGLQRLPRVLSMA